MRWYLTLSYGSNYRGVWESCICTFQKKDSWSRRRWSKCNILPTIFWKRRSKEYLPLLHSRQEWTSPCKNLAVGDIFLINVENSPRNTRRLGRAVEVLFDRKDLVRRAKVKVTRAVVERPINKLCLLLEAWAFPPEWLLRISWLHLIEDLWKRYLELIQLKYKCLACTPLLGAGM